MSAPRRDKDGNYKFADYPEFRPNLSPRQMFKAGSFGGTYWRPISSKITNKNHKNVYKKYKWWNGIPDDHLTRDWDDYDKTINKYGVKVGTTLEFWESKGWITKYHPYGWVHWYCDFFMGKRGPDDQRQIDRWAGICGQNGRFRKWLVTEIQKKKGRYDDHGISPKIRQTLLHWGYELTKDDYDAEIKERKSKRKSKRRKSKQNGGSSFASIYHKNKDDYLRLISTLDV